MKAKQLNLVPLQVSLLVLSVLAVLAIAAKSVGIVLNVTGSMPAMVYRLGNGKRQHGQLLLTNFTSVDWSWFLSG
ncbi:MAG TPA: hypothetical protein PKH72_08815 [Rhodoferax sp.]|nr:hypothetical protein [Rhodoferax sp.]